MKKQFFLTLLLIVTCFFSGWTWELFKNYVFLGLASILLSYFFLDYLVSRQLSKIRKFLLACLTVVILGYLLLISLDRKIFIVSELEQIQIKDRYQYFFKELKFTFANNKIFVYYVNKIRPVLIKYLDNEARVFDVDTYFPARFPMIYLPFALIGLIRFLKFSNKWSISYMFIIALITGITDTASRLGPIAFYPHVVAFISAGFISIWNIKRK